MNVELEADGPGFVGMRGKAACRHTGRPSEWAVFAVIGTRIVIANAFVGGHRFT